jgi:hypothetical protein
LQTRLALNVHEGTIVGATFSGPDLFVRWTELDTLHTLDEAKTPDRALAANHVKEVLLGMIEARFPSSNSIDASDGSLITRQHDALVFSAKQGAAVGDDDVVSVTHAR